MKKMLLITLLAFAAVCKIVPSNPMDPNDDKYQAPYLKFNENSLRSGDTITADEVVCFFSGSLGEKNLYRYKLDDKSWSDWKKVNNTVSEVRIALTRADTGKHTVTFQSSYHPTNTDIFDTVLTFFRITSPLIIFEPVDLTVTEGQSVSFSVIANGTVLLYQWLKYDEKLDSATSSMYSIPAAALKDAGRYSCIVYNRAGEIESRSAKLVVNKKIAPPLIATQPENKKVSEGQSVTFTIAATGTDLVYQWKKGNVSIPGASTSSYSIPAVATPIADLYSAVLSAIVPILLQVLQLC